MTGKVTLVQEIDADRQAGFLIYTPLYRGPQPPESEAERRERLVGFVYAPFRARDFITDISSRGLFESVDIAIYDGTVANDGSLLFEQRRLTGAGRKRALAQTRTLQVADCTWTFVYSAEVGSLISPLAVFLIGLAISGGAGVLLGR